jgi:hypothetical protein
MVKYDSLEPYLNRKTLCIKEIDTSLTKDELRQELLRVRPARLLRPLAAALANHTCHATQGLPQWSWRHLHSGRQDFRWHRGSGVLQLCGQAQR